MTEIRAGVVDVYVIQPLATGWRVLVLQRAPQVRCAGGWEAVHGSILPNEHPEDAARRELREETGLSADRLYSITVQPFYVVAAHVVQLAVVFAAFVAEDARVRLSEEHCSSEWLSPDEASERFLWPAERAALAAIGSLLKNGHAGAAEDVLRVP